LEKIISKNFNISENNIISAELANVLRYFFFPEKRVGGGQQSNFKKKIDVSKHCSSK